ncbi:tumor necrosis factor receptor superfamily member 5-like [Mytilus trossulus]|uniref:tumor necrosis factor receptor superfamily member 5-like n=1 Tax=Mytilus trossulus TaxID=6551 RepID=UPI003005ECE0
MKHLKYLDVYIILTVIFEFVLDVTVVYGLNESWSSYSKDGTLCYYCSPGTYFIDDCLTHNTQAQCKPCPTQTFITSKNIAIYCKPCTQCDHVVRNYYLAIVLEKCTSTSNTVCGCKPTHHFIQDHGGLGRGHCFENTKCSAGSGLIKQATMFSDTECTECNLGYTYSPFDSYESCIPCTEHCPNGTHIKNPCNRTNNIVCEKDKGLPTQTNNTKNDKLTMRLAIVCSTVIPVTIVIVCYIVLIKRRRRERPSNSFQLDDFMRDIPPWMKDCIINDVVNWPKLFGCCSTQGFVLPDWESFIRDLCRGSEMAEHGERIVALSKESYEKDKAKSRMYYAMDLWKQKNDTGDDIKMLKTFAWAFRNHRTTMREMVCCLK